MKTVWITLCFNEMDILPFVKKYWERIVCDVVVYDNGSTDGSIEYLSKLPYVTVKHFDRDGQDDVIQKQVKEQAYLEYKDKYDFIIITDTDEVFYFNDFKALQDQMIDGGYNILITPIYGLCEESKPIYDDSKYLHQLCHMFYKQKLNHMNGFDAYSKLSVFNTKITDKVIMSVGQHYVQTSPSMSILLSNNDFCLHIDKGFGISYKFRIRRKMNENLSDTNKKCGMCVEYGDSYEKLEQEYAENIKNSFDLNKIL